ncbi:hypothetical protein, conserved [Babesia ovata]|uniref:Extracellular matrix-binding ebh n=1 Tax=Babesia ovata TaxID=189622 RepID=A0A2H6KK00_9APIC|nr:uncharacterized protein BOVATA_048010 [Babesia ovata]GBE63308.1 hypothetical protein, conserved [Babesia ovata]
MKFITLLRMPDKEPWMILIPALSGFVGGGEEVKNALVKGLQSNVNQLDKLLKASCGDGKCHKVDEAIKKLNEVNESLKNKLKDEQKTPVNLTEILSKCKLNPSVGPLNQLNDEITEKIEKLNQRISELKKQHNDDNNSKNASKIDKLNKDLQSHNASKESLDTLEALCGYAKEVDKKSDNTKNLLDNLCGGLEKFLGHSNGNYTGEGIVYSDLDRLCDGVMSFLLQCLKGSQTLLSHYYPEITRTISELEGKIGKGSGVVGFREAIGIVQRGLRGYESVLSTKTDGVTSQLTSLIATISELNNEFNNMHTMSLSDQLNNVLVPKATECSNAALGVDLANSQLDDILSNKLTLSVELVTQAVETFQSSCDDRQVKQWADNVDKALLQQKEKINKAVETESRRVHERLENGRKAIEQSLENLINEKKKHIKAIKQAAQDAKEDVAELLGTLENLLKRLDEAQNGKLPHGGSIDKPTFEELQTSLKRAVSHAVDKVLKDVVGEDDINGKTDRVNKPFDPVFMNEYNEQTKNGNGGDGVLREIDLATLDGYNTQRSGSGDGTKTTYYRVMQKLSESINDLENLPTAIDNAKGESARKMEKLKQEFQTLQSDVINIERVVITANQQLSEYISSVGVALTTAHQQATQAVKALESTVTRTVSSAFSTLTAQVHSLFAKQKQAELTQLHTVVTAQLARIDEIIREDKATGVKGFFKEMNSLLEDQFQRSSLSDGMKLSELAVKAVVYFEGLFEYLDEEFTPRRPKAPRQGPGTQNHDPHAAMVENIRTALNALLAHLCKTTGKAYNFDYTFSKNLDALLKSVADLSAEKFGEGKHADLLNLLKDGVNDFGRQLEDAYVNRYAERVWSENDSTKYAKVCLTTFPMLLTGLKELKENIEKSGNSWRRYAIYNSRQPQSSLYGVFLRDNGYDVGRDEYIQRGELNYKTGFNGGNILQHLTSANHVLFSPSANSLSGLTGSTGDDDDADLPIEVVNEEGILPQLHSYLKPYAETCHLSTFSSKKSPCSIYEMLLWLTGLQFNSVYESLIDHIHSLFLVDDDSQPPQKILKPIDAYPKSFLPNDVNYALDHICSHSYAVLTALIGTGDAYTNYACDFSCNHIGLHYPTSGEKLSQHAS